jgi:hypothetical protein
MNLNGSGLIVLCYPRIFLGLRKTMDNLSQNSRCPGPDLNRGSIQYKQEESLLSQLAQ